MIDIRKDDLSGFSRSAPAFVTFGEVMVRDTPADDERPERTRLVHISLAGSEYSLAIGLSRLGIPSAFITRLPDNPYGRMVQNIARENGVNVDHLVWAPKVEPIGRYIYEMGRTPRKTVCDYQRMYSAASRLDAGMVNWKEALKGARLFHSSGINFGLASHSHYDRNYNLEAYMEALGNRPADSRVGLDFNFRSTLWSVEEARRVITPIITDHVNILVTSIQDMAEFYGISCGQYSARDVENGDIGHLENEDIQDFARNVIDRFDVEIVAVTIRYPDSFENHRWESAAMDASGNFCRSAEVKSIALMDRLGGGDTWNAGFYYGLLTQGFNWEGLCRGILVGDACTRLQQTLMFDLPILEKSEVQDLIKTDLVGGGQRVER